MSGLVVRPGDMLVLPLLPTVNLKQADEALKPLAAKMPDVTFAVAIGVAGGPFVYRPDPKPDPTVCTCELIDTSTPGKVSFARGEAAGCPVHGDERDAEIAEAQRIARYSS